MRARWFLIGVVPLLTLGACSHQGTRFANAERPVLPATYCYNTLGVADCYDVPIEPEVRRMNNYYGPAPVVRGSNDR